MYYDDNIASWLYSEDATTCDWCGSSRVLEKAEKHGSLVDHTFSCPCGCKWCYITEGPKVLRKQIEYPR